jgi:hypothetical protein
MNKNKILGSLAVLAIVVIAAFNVNVNSQNNALSGVALDNVEALAYELDEVVITCGQYTGQCWKVDEFPRYPWSDFTCFFTGAMIDLCFN